MTLLLNSTRTTEAPTAAAPGSVTLARATSAEWIKFRSLRSTGWTVVTTIVLMVGVSVLAAWGTTQLDDAGTPRGEMNVAQLLSAGYQLAQLGVAVLGVLMITGEYSTGMIRATFTAVPSRLPVLWAKAVVLTGAVLAMTLVAMALSYLTTMPFHRDLRATFDLSDAETLRMTIGLPLYLAAIGLLAFAVGALIRHSAAALTGVIALLLVVENVLFMIPVRAVELVSPFLPSTAGRLVLFDHETLTAINAAGGGADPTPWQGYAVLIMWVAVLTWIAGARLRRRDA
jgi:ABC-2 type transport system permease protein